MHKMLALPSLFAFLMPLPAMLNKQDRTIARKRRAIRALHLSPHILADVGLEHVEGAHDDPRWVRRFDLER